MQNDNMPAALRLSEGLGPLVGCPFCGASNGYTLGDGSTFRWWIVLCADCGADVAECRSVSSTKLDAPKPARWPAADEEWNAAGAHAHMLRTALAMAVRQNEHDMLMTGDELRTCRLALGPNVMWANPSAPARLAHISKPDHDTWDGDPEAT